MEGNLAKYIEKERADDLKLKDFYNSLRKCNTDLFLFKDCYVVALQDRSREFNQDGSVKANEGDLFEISNVFNFEYNASYWVKLGGLKPLNEIYLLEYNRFKGIGIKEIPKKGYFSLPQNMIESFRRND